MKKLIILILLLFAVSVIATSAKSDAEWVVNDSGLTYTQMLALTPQDVKDQFPAKNLSGTYIKNVLRLVAHRATDMRDTANMQALKGQAKNWLDSNFPDWEAEKGQENGRSYVKIFWEGK